MCSFIILSVDYHTQPDHFVITPLNYVYQHLNDFINDFPEIGFL